MSPLIKSVITINSIISLYLLAFSTVFVIASPSSFASDISSVEAELLAEIKRANKAYQQQTQAIAKQRRQLLKQLASQEQTLKKLSVEAKLITRTKDEQNLSVTKLEERLASWQQQYNYLNHLLASIDNRKPITSLAALSERIEQHLKPTQFEPMQVALTSGELINGEKLSVGPANIFISGDNQQAGLVAGLVTQVEQTWQLALQYDDAQTAAALELQQNQRGTLALDATNNRSLILNQHQETIAEHLNKGGIWIVPILAFALLALTIAGVKAVSLSRLPKLKPALSSIENTSTDNSKLGIYQQRLLTIAKQNQHSQTQSDDLLFDQLMQIKQEIERGLSAIAVTAAVAPLLGLLGTVSGMIQTFKLMTLFGAGDANAVSGGISESLVTTELGLIVAIPALVAHALMSRRCHHYMNGLESFAIRLSHQQVPPPENNTSVTREVTNVA
ncbi:hypothetical protein DXX93_10235 [Thalassotalea euphylliae]|uniref:MotA/TolQ/ExbB proton channel domain-containing protein n=1 Tax=Thalassotalea euphylliae TaxID=1655234 RepID=A0A3E0TRC6_9GAMM|nr:MotA/TolQ/ExbB proton channel family protein [Thalassotalea euphylliae]REL26910.1 hypothetical protein DXX93_10235 [Thalassotalea euphylliae]